MIKTIYGLVTLVLIIVFIGLCFWAYNPKNKKKFEKDSELAFGDDGVPDKNEQDENGV